MRIGGRWLRPLGGFILAAVLAALARPAALPGAAAQDAEISCKDCHEEIHDAAANSIHAKVVADPHLDDCRMCHIGAQEHIRLAQESSDGRLPKGGGFTKPPDCLLCHRHEPARHQKTMPAFRENKDAACTTCHRAHAPRAETAKGRGLLEKATADALRKAGAALAGETTCAKCHSGPVKRFKDSAHGKGGATCESCHGPASLHIATGGSRMGILTAPLADSAAMARLCLACHEKDAPDHAKDFPASKHAEGGKTCASCHRVHSPDPNAGKKAGGRCAECHKEPHPGLDKSRHGPLMGKERVGCEGCHGEGTLHVESGGKALLILNPARLPATAKDGLCLSCHQKVATPASWGQHAHGQAGIGCLSCHDPFAPPGEATKAPQPGLCASCHGPQVAQFRLPNHHPVDTGAMKCSDCHEMHRAAPPSSAAKRWTDACAACHRSEATPRMFPHEAGRADGCIACHEPHGTTTPRLLKFSRVVHLCLSCHIPPVTHDLSPSAGFTSCLACHTEIHGSDAHRQFLR